MSIIERTNPLNLQYRIVIVTSASTDLGVIICKTLLKANAFVVGIDSRPKDDDLSVGAYTHFQFLQRDVNDSDVPEAVIAHAREVFRREAIWGLVNVFEEGREGELEGLRRLTEVVERVMGAEGEGCIVNVAGDVEGGDGKKMEGIVEFTKIIAEQYEKDGIRCNAIAPGPSANHRSATAWEHAKTHFKEIKAPSKNPEEARKAKIGASKHYEVGNLALFLAGDLSEGISGSVVRLDGTHQ